MNHAFWIIVLVIGGCVAFVTALHFMGEGHRIASDLAKDQAPGDEFKAQIDAEMNKEILKGISALLTLLPSVAIALYYFTGLGIQWLWFGLAILPFIRYRAKKKIYAKYGIQESTDQ